MAVTVIIAMILALGTSCQAAPYLVESPMSKEIVSGGTAEFTCMIGGRTTETIVWFTNILDTNTYFDIPALAEANPISVNGFEYNVESSLDGDEEYYRLIVSEVTIQLRFTFFYTTMFTRTTIADWISLTLITPASTTSLPSSPTSREDITTIKLDPTTTSQNGTTITGAQYMSGVAAIAGGVACCTVVIIFLIAVILYLRIRHGYCYTCKITKPTNSDTIVPSEPLNSNGIANNGFTVATKDGKAIGTPDKSYALSNEELPTYALLKEKQSTPGGEMLTYALPKKRQSTPGDMPTYALPEKRQSTPAVMPTHALQKERQSSHEEIPTYALPNKRQSSPAEIPTHVLSDKELQNDSTKKPPTYATPDKTRNKTTSGEMPTYALPNKRQSTAVNKTPDCGKYLATVNEMPSIDQLGDPLYAEVPREYCESNDVDLAYAVVPIEMDKMPKTNATIEGLHYADVELTSSKEDAQFKQDATLYADIKL